MTEKFDFVDAKPVKENWSIYKLPDNTIVKIRYIVVKARRGPIDDFGQPSYGLNMKSVIGILPPKHLLDKPSPPYDKKTLVESIEAEDIEFEKIKEPWNEYKLEDGTVMKIKAVLTIISKTTKYDENGEPVYLMNFQPVVKGIPFRK